MTIDFATSISLSEIVREHPFVGNSMDSREAVYLHVVCFESKNERKISSLTARLCQKYRNLLFYHVSHQQTCVRTNDSDHLHNVRMIITWGMARIRF